MSLTDRQINAHLKGVPNFRGCVMRTQLRGKRPGFYAVNLDGSHGGGTHWVFLEYRRDGKASLYIDSFGCPPPKAVTDAVGRVVYSTNVLQPEWSENCGRFVAYFVKALAKGRRPQAVIHDFTANTADNDRRVVWSYAH